MKKLIVAGIIVLSVIVVDVYAGTTSYNYSDSSGFNGHGTSYDIGNPIYKFILL